jgi:transcriptional regulator with XRE-family HTH domain
VAADLADQPEALRRAVVAGPVGAVVRLARMRARLSQAELGAACGGHRQSTISRLEAGRVVNPDRRTLARIADVLGIRAEWFGVTPRTVEALQAVIMDY